MYLQPSISVMFIISQSHFWALMITNISSSLNLAKVHNLISNTSTHLFLGHAAEVTNRPNSRSQNTPKHRPSTAEREHVRYAKKRLAYPVPDPRDNGSDSYNDNYCDYGHNLRCLSFRSVQVGGMGQ